MWDEDVAGACLQKLEDADSLLNQLNEGVLSAQLSLVIEGLRGRLSLAAQVRSA